MDAQLADSLFQEEGAAEGGGLVWPDTHDASTLLPVPRSPSSVSSDSFGSAFSSSQQTVAAAAGAASMQGADADAGGPGEEDVPTPRRPRTAYILFTQAVRDRVKRDLEAKKGHKLSDGPKVMGKSGKNMNASNIVTVAIAQLWKRTTPAAKRAYEEAAARDMQRFKAEMADYKRRQQQAHPRVVHAYVQRQRTAAKPKQAAAVVVPVAPPPSPPAQLLSPSPPPMPPRPQKQKPPAAPPAAAQLLPRLPKGPAAASLDGASPSMPRKPPGAFLLWSHKPRGELRKQKDPQLDNGAVSRILGDRWRGLTQEEKAPWIALANARLEEYLRQKRAYLEASGLPLPGTSRKRRKTASTAAATTTAASSVASSSSSSSLASLASAVDVRPAAVQAAAAASFRLAHVQAQATMCKGPAAEKAERQEEGEGHDEAEDEREAQRAFWAAGGYMTAAAGATGAGEVVGEQQQPLTGLADDAFDAAAMLLGDGAEGGVSGGAFLLDMDFSDIADESLFCDSPGMPLVA